MFKRISLFICLINAFMINSEETTKRTIIKEDNKNFGIIKYIDDFYDEDKLIKSELIFTEEYVLESGRIKQIELYDISGKVISYDSFFNNAYNDFWGINRSTEFLKDGNYTHINYTFYNNSTYKFNESHIQSTKSHPVRLLMPLIEKYRDEAKSKELFIPLGERITTCVSIEDSNIVNAEIKEIELIQEWFTAISNTSDPQIFGQTILVDENGKKIKLFVLSQLLENITSYDECVVYGIYIGVVDGSPVTLVVGINENKI